MLKKFIISCDEATMICDKNQYGEASLYDLIRLNFHFLRCKICALYTKQNMILTKAYKKRAGKAQQENHATCLSHRDKDRFKEELKKMTLEQ